MSEFQAIAAGFLIVAGVATALLGSLGICTMTDLFLRSHAAGKSSTLGAACLLLAAAARFGEFDLGLRAILGAVFLFLTAPVASHMIARAAYLAKSPLAPGTVRDDLAGRYRLDTRELASPEPRETPTRDDTPA